VKNDIQTPINTSQLSELADYIYQLCLCTYSIASRYKHATLKEGGRNGRPEMERFYRDHRIELSVGLDRDAWMLSIFIYYSEGLQNILVTFPMDQEFETYDDAMEAGLAAAKKWIDERTSNRGPQ
jgi:hypothetical protein